MADKLRDILDIGGGSAASSNSEAEHQDSAGKYFTLAMDQVFNATDLDLRTHVSDREIKALSKAETISKYFGKIPLIDDYCDKMKRLLISKNRGSRNEMREIAVGVSASGDPEKAAEQRRLEGLLGKR